MKTWTVAAALLFVSTCGFAQTEQAAPARKSCEDLKSEITKKLEAKGVTSYTLDVVDKGKEGDGKVVGGCGGTKSIVYTRGGGPAESKSADAKKPE